MNRTRPDATRAGRTAGGGSTEYAERVRSQCVETSLVSPCVATEPAVKRDRLSRKQRKPQRECKNDDRTWVEQRHARSLSHLRSRGCTAATGIAPFVRVRVERRAAWSDDPLGLLEWAEMVEDLERELPDDDDVIIWHLEERDGLDVYRVTKGEATLGEFTGRSIGATVFQKAVEHAEPGRAVWLKDERRFRRLNPPGLLD